MFSNSNISVDVKRAVYEGRIFSILLLSTESWFLTEKLFSMLRTFHNRCVRSMCKVTVAECYNFRISNEKLLRRLNFKKINDYITKRQLRWAGHGFRSTSEKNVIFVGFYALTPFLSLFFVFH